MILYALFQAILDVEIHLCTNIVIPYIQTFWWVILDSLNYIHGLNLGIYSADLRIIVIRML